MIAFASRSLRLSQRRYCTTRREMLAAVVMCTHFRSYLRRTDHSALRWLQKFRNEDGMLARWYLLLGQFSVTFEYRPGSLHSNADGMSRQCGQCRRPDCPVSAADLPTIKDLRDMYIQHFVYQFVNDSLPKSLLHIFEYNRDIHRHNTRHSNDSRPLKANSDIMRRSLLCRGPILWIDLNIDIRNSRTKHIFKKRVMQSYLRTY